MKGKRTVDAPFKKNEELDIEIEGMGNEGEGIGRANGYALFVKDAIPGDVARVKVTKAKKNYAYARLVKILAPSKNRVEPICPIAKQCGGCQLQHMDYQAQLTFKENKVKNCLQRIGGLEEFELKPIMGMEKPFRYRNKAQFPIGRNRDGKPAVGFYAARTHLIMDADSCLIQAEVNDKIVGKMRMFLKKYGIIPYDESTNTGLVRHIITRIGIQTGEVMACIVINGTHLPHAEALVELLKTVPGMKGVCLNVNREETNVILGKEMIPLWGESHVTDYIGDVRYCISPASFYQVNPLQTRKLYEMVLQYAGLTGREIVWDLYCGIGTIALYLARKAKYVYGVEVVEQAVEDARKNASLNGMDNVEFFTGAVEEIMPRQYDESKGKMKADVIVVDPPRKGCDESLLKTIVDMKPDRVVYVSCDPATLARDLKCLSGGGYDMVKVQSFDFFPQTAHVETCVLLSHKKPDSHINVKVEFGEGEGKVPLDEIAEKAKAYKPKERVTYKMIQKYIENKYGFKVHTAYIAEVKKDLGLPMYDAPNAVEELKYPQKHPTPEKVEAIKEALKHFEII